jgi:hypothetical protein
MPSYQTTIKRERERRERAIAWNRKSTGSMVVLEGSTEFMVGEQVKLTQGGMQPDSVSEVHVDGEQLIVGLTKKIGPPCMESVPVVLDP